METDRKKAMSKRKKKPQGCFQSSISIIQPDSHSILTAVKQTRRLHNQKREREAELNRYITSIITAAILSIIMHESTPKNLTHTLIKCVHTYTFFNALQASPVWVEQTRTCGNVVLNHESQSQSFQYLIQYLLILAYLSSI